MRVAEANLAGSDFLWRGMRRRSPIKARLRVPPQLLSLAAQGWSQSACEDSSPSSPGPKAAGPRTSWAASAQPKAPHPGLPSSVQRSLGRSLGLPTSSLRKGTA